MASGGGFTIVSWMACCVDPGGLAESARAKVTGPDAVLVGVPLSSPVAASRLSPAGNVPDATDHLYGGVPPFAPSCCEYFTPTVPCGKVVLAIVSGPAGVTTNWKTLLFTPLAASVSVKVNEKVPDEAGVPDTRPVFASTNMPGEICPGVGNVTIAGCTAHV